MLAKTYEFALFLAEGAELTDELVESLFDAGCDDGGPWCSGGAASVGFNREAESFEAAIRSAIADVEKTGSRVARVQSEADALAST